MAVKGLKEDVLLVEFVYLVFICMPGESYRRRLGSLLLHLYYVFRALTVLILHERSGPRSVSVSLYSDLSTSSTIS